jgi:hypothetical protein
MVVKMNKYSVAFFFKQKKTINIVTENVSASEKKQFATTN